MAVVFSRELDRLDLEDVQGSLGKLESYIRYMQEQIDFSVRGLSRTVNESAPAGAAMYARLLELEDTAAATASQAQTLAAELAEAKGELGGLKTRLGAAETALAAAEGRMTALESRVTALEAV